MQTTTNISPDIKQDREKNIYTKKINVKYDKENCRAFMKQRECDFVFFFRVTQQKQVRQFNKASGRCGHGTHRNHVAVSPGGVSMSPRSVSMSQCLQGFGDGGAFASLLKN